MPRYQAPLADMQFLMQHVFKVDALWQGIPALSEFNGELSDAVLTEAAKFCTGQLQPLNQIGDQQGCSLTAGIVKTPEGFKAAWQEFADSGWVGLAGNAEFGGQGLPKMLSLLVEEMVYGANTSFQLYSGLTAGAALLLDAHASEDIKAQYLPKLYSGEWCGTMCLTEPHAGTDLGLIRTKAQLQTDGSYLIDGSKIFITGGDQDLTSNIIHLVLARTPDAPLGVKGISLFLVPKVIAQTNNGVSCGALEHKMGIKGSATCVMNFDGATGWLVGELNQGLAAMFTMMNYERLSIGLQGLGLAEVAYQNALSYAHERKQSKAANSPNAPSFIVELPDVQRMLMQQKSFIEAGRCFALYVGMQLDIAKFSDASSDVALAKQKVALLTPIAKAFLTDMGFDACVQAQQVFGGHGFIAEWGMEQFVRDARIAQIYEGTNGIQALDLLARKVIADQGAALQSMCAEISSMVNRQSDFPWQQHVLQLTSQLQTITQTMLQHEDLANQSNGLAVEYLHACGYVFFSYMWLLQWQELAALDAQTQQQKRATMAYWFDWQVAQVHAHFARLQQGWSLEYAAALS